MDYVNTTHHPRGRRQRPPRHRIIESAIVTLDRASRLQATCMPASAEALQGTVDTVREALVAVSAATRRTAGAWDHLLRVTDILDTACHMVDVRVGDGAYPGALRLERSNEGGAR